MNKVNYLARADRLFGSLPEGTGRTLLYSYVASYVGTLAGERVPEQPEQILEKIEKLPDKAKYLELLSKFLFECAKDFCPDMEIDNAE